MKNSRDMQLKSLKVKNVAKRIAMPANIVMGVSRNQYQTIKITTYKMVDR
jgi:hypothetical protein